MEQRIMNIDGGFVITEKHGKNDYSIFFQSLDCSVRGTLLDIIKAFAEWQWSELDEPMVSFEYNDQTISNPWIDTSARFPLDDASACAEYGEDNVFQFIIDACSLLRPDC